MFSLFNIFRIIAFLEGVSYILLLGIAVPIKYAFDNPTYVKLLGMPHGLLFIAYVILAVVIGSKLKWNNKTLFYVLLASIIPFGTFFVDKKYLKHTS
jgi:integral membrane protein